MNVRLKGMWLLLLGSLLMTGCGPQWEKSKHRSKHKDGSQSTEPGDGHAATKPKIPDGPGGHPTTKSGESNPSPPVKPVKTAGELKTPPNLSEAPKDILMPASSWKVWQGARIGDWVEMEIGPAKSRTEVFDIADHAVMQLVHTTITLAEQETKSTAAMKYLFTEPDEPKEKKPTKNEVKSETKKVNKTFQLGTQQVTADTLTETYENGKLLNRVWTSSQVPTGGLVLLEDGEGKTQMKLTGFGRGK